MQVGECPLWHPDEAVLYWIDIPDCTVHRHDPATGEHRRYALPTEPGCIVRSARGGLIVAMRSGIARLDTGTGTVSMLLPAPYDTTTTRFNDGRCDASGRLWVGSMYEPRDRPAATLYCLDRGVLRDAAHLVTVSNGVAFSADGTTLYHADTTAHAIRAYAFDGASGRASNGRLLRQFSTDKSSPAYGGRPDGAAVDSEGAYWVAMFEGGRLLRLDANGDILQQIDLPVRCPTMMAFGGADLQTLYITTARHNRSAEELERLPLSGCVLSMRVDVAGQVEPAYVD